VVKAQIIFVGLSKDAAFKSFYALKDSDTDFAIGIFTKKSKDNWNELKRKLRLDFPNIKTDEFAADFNNIESVVESVKWIESKYYKYNKTINITGLSKPGMLGLLLYYALNPKIEDVVKQPHSPYDNKITLFGAGKGIRKAEGKKTKVVMREMNEKTVVFDPHMIFALAAVFNKKKMTLGMRILEELNAFGAPMPFKDLAKKIGSQKPTVLESIKVLERDGLVERKRNGKNSNVCLNDYLYYLLKLRDVKTVQAFGNARRAIKKRIIMELPDYEVKEDA